MAYILKPHFTRKYKIYSKDDAIIPAELFKAECVAPNLDGFPYPLPSKKSEYTCYAEGNNGVVWYGATTGLTRYDKDAERIEDRIMFFSAPRHLAVDKVDALLAEGNDVWVLTGDKVSHIEMVMLTCEEKAEILLDETNKYVMRRGMVAQRGLQEIGNIESIYPYASSDNDGTFTAGHAIGEIYHYAVLRDKLGVNHPRTQKALKYATMSCEACLLLMYIHGRPEGFIARSYHLPNEPVPDDGLFYIRDGKVARLSETTASKERGIVGQEVACDYPIPERLARLYRDLGFTDDGIAYKADTSSDEVTSHYLHMKIAHDILGPVDPELDEIIKDACKRTMNHIIDGGMEFIDVDRPTTWAKWSKRYFSTSEFGYVDAPLNAGEVLSYLKVVMHITGEKGIWEKTYNKLVEEGYAELTTKHYDRFFQGALACGCAPEEELMYGDNFLATASLWLLCTLEKDPELLATYRKAYEGWKGTVLREHNPGYEFPFLLSVPGTDIDIAKACEYFYRSEMTRYVCATEVERHDTAKKNKRSGGGWSEYEISALLMPDERTVHKYDRNPYAVTPKEWQPGRSVEGCYVYTFAYWIGRYFGIIDEE